MQRPAQSAGTSGSPRPRRSEPVEEVEEPEPQPEPEPEPEPEPGPQGAEEQPPPGWDARWSEKRHRYYFFDRHACWNATRYASRRTSTASVAVSVPHRS